MNWNFEGWAIPKKKLYILWKQGCYSNDSIVGYFLDKDLANKYIENAHNDIRTANCTYWIEEENIMEQVDNDY